jgi:hypothetical protein
LDTTRPDHAWLGRTQYEVAVCVNFFAGADSKVAICFDESFFAVTECLAV